MSQQVLSPSVVSVQPALQIRSVLACVEQYPGQPVQVRVLECFPDGAGTVFVVEALQGRPFVVESSWCAAVRSAFWWCRRDDLYNVCIEMYQPQ